MKPFCQICGIDDSIVETRLGPRCWFHIPKADEFEQFAIYSCAFCGRAEGSEFLEPSIMGWACKKECAAHTNYKAKENKKLIDANTLVCQTCGREFVFTGKRGRKPKFCTKMCRNRAPRRSATIKV